MNQKPMAPGPCKVKRRYYIVDVDGENVCRIVADPTAEAYTRAIAAVPDLLILARAVARTCKTEAWGNRVSEARFLLAQIGVAWEA